MKKYDNPNIRKQTIALLDPLGLSSKINISKKTIAFLYSLGLGLVITGALLNKSSQLDVVLVIGGTAMSITGGILVMISWIGALLNSAKASRWGWAIFLFFLAL